MDDRSGENVKAKLDVASPGHLAFWAEAGQTIPPAAVTQKRSHDLPRQPTAGRESARSSITVKGKLYRQRHLVNFPPGVCGNLSLNSRERGILLHQIYALGSCQDERMTLVEEKEWARQTGSYFAMTATLHLHSEGV